MEEEALPTLLHRLQGAQAMEVLVQEVEDQEARIIHPHLHQLGEFQRQGQPKRTARP